jgi:hypothetical protein
MAVCVFGNRGISSAFCQWTLLYESLHICNRPVAPSDPYDCSIFYKSLQNVTQSPYHWHDDQQFDILGFPRYHKPY